MTKSLVLQSLGQANHANAVHCDPSPRASSMNQSERECRTDHGNTPSILVVSETLTVEHDSATLQQSQMQEVALEVPGALEAAQPVSKVQSFSKRDVGFDLFRGVVIILMMLDHVAYKYLKWVEIHQSPGEWWAVGEDEYPSAPKDGFDIFYFILRTMITNTVVAAFCLMMGMSLHFSIDSRQRLGWDNLRMLRYFVVRGLLIAVPINAVMVVQIWVDEGAGQFNLWHSILFELGIALALAALAVVPLRSLAVLQPHHLDAMVWSILGFSCLVISQSCVYAARDAPDSPSDLLAAIFTVTHGVGRWSNLYTVLPLLGVTLLGAAYGKLHQAVGSTSSFKAAFPFGLGVACIVVFAALRSTNSWGNTHTVQSQVDNGEVYWEAFFKTAKYPMSIAAAIFSVGFNLLLLALCVRLCSTQDRVSTLTFAFRVPVELGGASLMAYIAHLWLLTVLEEAIVKR